MADRKDGRARGGAVLAAFLLCSGLGGECRWSFKSGNRKEDPPPQGSDQPEQLSLGGRSDSVLPVPGARALLSVRTEGIGCFGEILWLDLETGRSWPLLHWLDRPWLVRVLDDRFEFAQFPCEPMLFSCRFDEDAPVPVGPLRFGAVRCSPQRTLFVDPSGTLHWTEGGMTVQIPLSFPAAGAVHDPSWPAPLAWDEAGDLFWIDVLSGAGIPAFPLGQASVGR
ncbi:MAG TPA: hypothetical protein VFI25_18485 [Planctomycetota bacterium]|jgi:hypothetical protein|nr:hypothetical protein [Planctomycetota bacterium]